MTGIKNGLALAGAMLLAGTAEAARYIELDYKFTGYEQQDNYPNQPYPTLPFVDILSVRLDATTFNPNGYASGSVSIGPNSDPSKGTPLSYDLINGGPDITVDINDNQLPNFYSATSGFTALPTRSISSFSFREYHHGTYYYPGVVGEFSSRVSDYPLGPLGVTEVFTALPEPTTWAMMVLGFGAAGALMRRRDRVPARAC